MAGLADPAPGVYVRSFYFQDPDGITLEFACWIKEFTEADTTTVPRTARRPPARAVVSRGRRRRRCIYARPAVAVM